MTDRAADLAPLPPERYARWSNFGKWETVWFPQSGTVAASGTLVCKVSSKPLVMP